MKLRRRRRKMSGSYDGTGASCNHHRGKAGEVRTGVVMFVGLGLFASSGAQADLLQQPMIFSLEPEIGLHC